MTAFDIAYEGTPSWEIGRPQAAVLRAVEDGLIAGRVLDLGCGTGENAIYLATCGLDVLGIDAAAAAVERARLKARDRANAARFEVRDALRLGEAEEARETFDTALDVGLFHTLQPYDRGAYAEAVRSTLRPGGRLVLVCWSDRNPFGIGPERVRRRDIRATFRAGWRVESIADESLETLLPLGQVHAWRALIGRR